MKSLYIHVIFMCGLFSLISLSAQARTDFESETKTKTTKSSKFSPFKNKTIDFFPVPVFETRPDEGESYGAMPVLLFSDKDTDAISLIIAVLAQYNSVVKWSGASFVHFFPAPVKNPEETLEFFVEYGQKYARETTLHYLNPHLLHKFYLDARLTWLKTPFTRFYGYGAASAESDESNYVSNNYMAEITFGYYLNKVFRLNFSEKFTSTDILTRAFLGTSDTLTRYGALPGVNDSTDFIHTFSATLDTRPKGTYSLNGQMVEAKYFFSHKSLGSDTSFQGYSLEAIHMFSFFKNKTTTALRFFMQDMNGTGIPLYLQSTLGGPNEFRSFIPNRFTDTGKIIITWEQRIEVIASEVFGVAFKVSVDPFLEVGRVFNHLDNIGFNNVQPIGGIGIRGIVPPNVVGRVDFAIGTQAYGVYTMLGYAF